MMKRNLLLSVRQIGPIVFDNLSRDLTIIEDEIKPGYLHIF